MATFAGGLAAAGLLGRALRRDPPCQSAVDFVVRSAASFKSRQEPFAGARCGGD
jgi:hypothetical protein